MKNMMSGLDFACRKSAPTVDPFEKFDNWTTTGVMTHNGKDWVAECECECGEVRWVRIRALRNGHSTGCGCTRQYHTIHGGYKTRAYTSWKKMLTMHHHGTSKIYLGGGVVERWLDFSEFFQDMGERPEGARIHRPNKSKPFGPGNCIWR